MKFKSKVDWWIHLIFGGVTVMNLWTLVDFAVNGGVISAIVAVVSSACSLFLIFPIWLNTYYVLEENELLVRNGLGKGTRIAYAAIKNVRESGSLVASSALSLDRVEIAFDTGMVLISPKDKPEFLRQLALKMS